MNVKFDNANYSSVRLSKSVSAIINRIKLCAMATVGSRKQSHVNTAYFCFSKELDIFFVSDIHTVHSKNVFARPTMAISIYDSRQTWGNALRGLQLFGKCALADPDEAKRGEALYVKRFPDYGEHINSLSEKERKRSPHKFFIFRTSQVKVFDEDNLGEETFVLATVIRGD